MLSPFLLSLDECISSVIPAKAGIHKLELFESLCSWIPVYTGMTGYLAFSDCNKAIRGY